MGIAVPSQLRKASHQLIMALIGYSGLGLGGYGWAGLGGLVAPLAIHRDGPFLCGDGEHLINGLCKKKRSADAEPEAYYGLGLGGYGWAGLGGLVAPLAIHRDGPFLCGNGEHLINGLCKKKRSADSEAYYGAIGYGYGAAVPPTGLPVQPLVPAGPWGALVPRKTPAVEAAEADHFAAIGKREADSDAYYGYGGYGGYGAYTSGYGLGYGYGGYGKRSADSEADAYYGYGGYGGYGLGYTTGYGLGYGYGGYGKR